MSVSCVWYLMLSRRTGMQPFRGPVLRCMRRKGAAVRFAFGRKARALVVETRADPGARVPSQAAGATPSPGNTQGH